MSDGGYAFADMAAGTRSTLRIPYTVEHDSVMSISVKLDVSYTTDNGAYVFSKTQSIPIALALGVNVQDVFKHEALFSRFNVSTASSSPLRLFKSELLGSAVFEPSFGTPPSRPVVIFPKQPACLLYRITRKEVEIGPKSQKTMLLKLHYSVLRDEIEAIIEASLLRAMADTPLSICSRTIVADVLRHVTDKLSASDLERATLLGEASTSFLADVAWETHFAGMGKLPTQEDAATVISSFLKGWQKSHPRLAIPEPTGSQERRCITIPVDVPSLPVIHTADIQLQTPLPSPSPVQSATTPVVSINQLLPATLRLRWSRIWNTVPSSPEPLEFTYDVAAPPDTWLLAGRRRGRFVVGKTASETTAPLLLVPLREGWLPFPIVEIHAADDSHCEVDHRNLGETVRVVADRERLTLSLDASGPGGGPLVLESERRGHEGRVVA